MKKWMTALALGVTAMAAQADAPAVRFYGNAGFTSGGDELASGNYTNGTSFSIKAGGGLLLNVGAAIAITDKVDGVITVGYHSASTSASNGDVSFSRNPVELLGFYTLDKNWRVGGGLRSAGSAKLTSSGAASAIGNFDFDNSMGTVLEVQYLFDKNPQTRATWGLSGRYVAESFEEKTTKTKVNGNHVGLSLVFYY